MKIYRSYKITLKKIIKCFIVILIITFFMTVSPFNVIIDDFQLFKLKWNNSCKILTSSSFSTSSSSSFASYSSSYFTIYPIDAVYTWVNGSDPLLIKSLINLKYSMKKSLATRQIKSSANCKKSSNNSNDYYYYRTHLLFIETLNKTQTKLKFNENTKIIKYLDNGFVISFQNPDEAEDYIITNIDNENVNLYPLFMKIQCNPMRAVNDTLPSIALGTIFIHKPSNHQMNLLKSKPSNQMNLFIDSNSSFVLINFMQLNHQDEIFDNNFYKSLFSKYNAFNLIIGNDNFFQYAHFAYEEEFALKRFADNDQLKYSLRSLEKYASWIRNIYIVTNGQIPSWLNLSHPKIHLITHQEIFTNLDDLPTFNSAAIECHLHRIPGLSSKFIYLNDDIMFGSFVYPDDFYTHSGGYKVYLSWPLPDCAPDCPKAWIKDGTCDQTCNTSRCFFDGGDCLTSPSTPSLLSFLSTSLISSIYKIESSSVASSIIDNNPCISSCPDAFLGDGDCDKACNIYLCGYDLGDCGPSSSEILHYQFNKTIYHVSSNILFSLDLSSFPYEIKDISYIEHENIRSISFNKKWNLLTGLLRQAPKSASLLSVSKEKANISIVINKNNHSVPLSILLGCDEDIRVEDYTDKLKIIKEFEKLNETNVYPKIYNISNLPDIQWDGINDKRKFWIKELEVNNDLTSKGKLYLLQHLWANYTGNKSIFQWISLNNSGINDYSNQTTNESINESKLRKKRDINRLQMITSRDEFDNNNKYNFNNDINYYNNYDNNIYHSYYNNNNYFHYNNNYYYNEKISYIPGLFPWEYGNFFYKDMNRNNLNPKSRRLLDIFADSLLYVNNIYNNYFGIKNRKVLAHSAHMLDVNILNRLHNLFYEKFAITSSHKIRSSNDMQYAFSYFYYLMSEKYTLTMKQVYSSYDTDKSGSLSKNELRTLMVNANSIPLTNYSIQNFINKLSNCSNTTIDLQSKDIEIPLDSMRNCTFPTILRKKYLNKFEIIDDQHVSFKMVRTETKLISDLDSLRLKPTKFICFNDDIDYNSPNAHHVQALLKDFYEYMFPLPSSFEKVNNLYDDININNNNNIINHQRLEISILINILLLSSSCIWIGLLVIFCKIYYKKKRVTRQTKSV